MLIYLQKGIHWQFNCRHLPTYAKCNHLFSSPFWQYVCRFVKDPLNLLDVLIWLDDCKLIFDNFLSLYHYQFLPVGQNYPSHKSLKHIDCYLALCVKHLLLICNHILHEKKLYISNVYVTYVGVTYFFCCMLPTLRLAMAGLIHVVSIVCMGVTCALYNDPSLTVV